MIILVVFAAFASIGFIRGLAALLWMSTILSAVIGTIRREQPFGASPQSLGRNGGLCGPVCSGHHFNHSVPV